MGGCCSSAKNEGVNDDEEQGELEQLLRDQQGLTDDAPMIQMHIKCRNLRHPPGNSRVGKVPVLHSINPFVSASIIEGDKKTLIAYTEQKFGNPHPEFVKALTTTYEHEAQEILFECIDRSRNQEVILGSAKLKILDIMSHDKGTEAFLEKQVKQVRKGGDVVEVVHRAGMITINAEEAKYGPKYEVVMDVSCHSLDSKNVIERGSDPYMVVSRIINGQFTSVYTTEHFDNVNECEWKPIIISLEKLCKGDFNSWLLLEVWDYENKGPHKLIGYTRQSLAMLLDANEKNNQINALDLINDNERGTERRSNLVSKKEYEKSGVLEIRAISIDISYSFLEYKRAGFDINVTICVDFSSSNLGQNLHHFDRAASDAGKKLSNPYSEALEKVVDILGTYDKDQEFPFYGFGAHVDRGEAVPNAKSSLSLPFLGKKEKANPPANIFHVTMEPNRYTVQGAEGILEAYWKVWKDGSVIPDEPTCFASCLSKVYRAGSGSKSAYQIALIVTDGGCDDMEATVDMIVDSSTEPISIIIVGVGEGPWENMDFLSADDEPLQSKRTKKMMKRDIVGFVEMNKYSTRESLQREVLKEIPRQFTSWAKQHKIKPGDNFNEKKSSREKTPKKSPEPTPKPMVDTATCVSEDVDLGPSASSVPPPPPLDNDGWESLSDGETGKMYYHNQISGVTQWVMPPGYRSRSGRGVKKINPGKKAPPSSAKPLDSPQHIADVPYVRLGAAQSAKKVQVKPLSSVTGSVVDDSRAGSPGIGNLSGLSGASASGRGGTRFSPNRQLSPQFPPSGYSKSSDGIGGGTPQRMGGRKSSYEPPKFSTTTEQAAREWQARKGRDSVGHSASFPGY